MQWLSHLQLFYCLLQTNKPVSTASKSTIHTVIAMQSLGIITWIQIITLYKFNASVVNGYNGEFYIKSEVVI